MTPSPSSDPAHLPGLAPERDRSPRAAEILGGESARMVRILEATTDLVSMMTPDGELPPRTAS